LPRYVALLQGINVGKHKRVAMADLRALVEGLGHADVNTHLNSGNVVFAAEDGANEELAKQIEDAIAARLGLDVPVVVRSGEELARILAGNPFPEAAADHTTLHVTFLGAVPDPERVAALAEVDRGEDDYRVVGADVYLSYPHKLTGATFMPTGLGKALGVVATSRNWRTVTRLAELTGAKRDD
jgi:uncharacterized protein (DUF1697 family)